MLQKIFSLYNIKKKFEIYLYASEKNAFANVYNNIGTQKRESQKIRNLLCIYTLILPKNVCIHNNNVETKTVHILFFAISLLYSIHIRVWK